MIGGECVRIRVSGRSLEEVRQEAGRFSLRLPPEELVDLVARLGRDPSLAEAFLFDVAQSEHCSYKSSRPLLKQYLPPLASHVVLGPGERFSVHANEQPRLLSVVSGSVRCVSDSSTGSKAPFGHALARGENALLPYAGSFTFSAESTAILLVTENFV